MNEKKQALYLSEVFLETLNGDFSLKAVLRALKKCDEGILQKSGMSGYASRFVKRIFRKDGLKPEVPENMRQELFDFWDVYKEFDERLTPGMKRKYLILQMV